MIQKFFSSALLVFGIGVAAYLSNEVFVWVELDDASHRIFILYGLLGWLLRYGLFLLAFTLFRAIAIPPAAGRLPDLRGLSGVLFTGLCLAGLLFFLQLQFGARVDSVARLQNRYRTHSVVRSFKPGTFFRGGGFLFRPGAADSNGYSRSLLLYTYAGTNFIFLDTAVEVGERSLSLQGGWRAGVTLQTNGNSSLPLRRGALFTPPSYPLELAGMDIGRLASRLFSWKLFSGRATFAILLEGGLFVLGLLFLMAGGALFVRRREMPVGHRFISHLLALAITSGPVFLFQFLQHSLSAQRPLSQALLFSRGGALFLIGLLVLVFGWRCYLRSLPSGVRASL